MAKTLLLADDSVTIQKVVGITFANQDVDLVTVDNGDDALEKAREIRPDVILADVNMPGLGGYELCRAIRAEPGIGTTPLLLLTGTFETFDESRALEVGASAHIAKPFEARALVEQVHRLLAAPTAPPAADASPPPDAAASEAFPTAVEDFSFDDLDFHSPAGGPASAEETQLLGGDPLSGPADPGPGPEPPVPAPVEELTRLDTSDPLYSDLAFVDPFHDGGDTRTEPVMEPAEAAGGEIPGFEPGSTAGTLPAERLGEVREHGEVSEVLGDLLLTEEDLFPDSGPESSVPATAEESAPRPVESLPGAGEPSGGEDLFFEEALPEVAPGPLVEPAGPGAEPEAPRVIEPAEEPVAAGLPALDERSIQESLEKLAWEAFGPLSEQIVREVVRKVEAIAWEVLPRLAERLIREEIERMKAHTPGAGEPSL